MNLEVLISCMYQPDSRIIAKSNLSRANALVVNQCDTQRDEMLVISPNHRMLNTSTRGLSVSRNIALRKSVGDVCLLADDDEVFADNVEDIIIRAYNEIPEADLIIFKVRNLENKLKDSIHQIHGIECYRIASVQISFRRRAIIDTISFDEKIGSGTQYGAGEDNKFILDCRKRGLKIFYYPVEIAVLNTQNSQWFNGYNSDFFYRNSSCNRYVMGWFLGLLYSLHFVVFKRKLYRNECSSLTALYNTIKGLLMKIT